MNRQQFNEAQQLNPTVLNTSIFEIDIDKVVLDKSNSQIRKDGAVTAKVPQMKEDILTNGQQIPASVKPLPNGKVVLKDGITRYLAKKELGQRLKVSTYHYAQFGSNNDDWKIFQASANDHETSTSNSRADIEHQISDMIKDGMLDRKLGFAYIGNEKLFVAESAKFLKEKVYKSSSLAKAQLKTIIKKNLENSDLISVRFESYTNSEALEFFEAHNTVGWKGNAVGKTYNNKAVYIFKDPSKQKDYIGNAVIKKMNEPDVELYAVIFVDKLAGKSEASIRKEEQKLYNIYKDITNIKANSIFRKPLYDGALFLPHLKDGENMQNLSKLYTAEELGLE